MKNNELLIRVVERYLYHKNYRTENTLVKEMQELIMDVEIAEMWMLTQK